MGLHGCTVPSIDHRGECIAYGMHFLCVPSFRHLWVDHDPSLRIHVEKGTTKERVVPLLSLYL